MSYLTDRERERTTYLRGLSALGDDHERVRTAELNKPFRGNDPALLKPTRCKVLKPFFVAGNRVEPDQVVSLPFHDAKSLAAAKKLEIIGG